MIKLDTILLIAAAGLGLWFITRTKAAGTPAPTATGAARSAAVLTTWAPADPWGMNSEINAATGYNPGGMLTWPN